jgi:hypothetical protein
MPSLAPHRVVTSEKISPANFTRNGHRYTLDYVDTSKKGAESIAELRREDEYKSVVVRVVEIKDPHYRWLLGKSKAWGVFRSGRGLPRTIAGMKAREKRLKGRK